MKAELRKCAGLVLAVSAATALVACAPKSDDELVRVDSTPAADTMAAGGAVNVITDEHIVAILNAVNDGDIEAAKLAETKATDAEVKAFARRMITDHTGLKPKVAAVEKKLGITPMTMKEDDFLEDQQKAMTDLREKKKGEEFDEAYIEHEIDVHKKSIDKIDDAIESTDNAELKTFLQQAKGAFEGHLKAAEEIEKKFGV